MTWQLRNARWTFPGYQLWRFVDRWHQALGDIVAMLNAADVEVAQRSESRVLLKKGAARIVVHRPHPEPETGRATVRDIAAFLDAVGVKP